MPAVPVLLRHHDLASYDKLKTLTGKHVQVMDIRHHRCSSHHAARSVTAGPKMLIHSAIVQHFCKC